MLWGHGGLSTGLNYEGPAVICSNYSNWYDVQNKRTKTPERSLRRIVYFLTCGPVNLLIRRKANEIFPVGHHLYSLRWEA